MRKICLLLSAIFLLLLNSKAQDRTVAGKVTDEKGAGLSNVSVLIKGTTTGTSTKSDGGYSITVPASGKQIQFSSLGYGTIIMNIGGRTNISVTLYSDSAKELTEVVITGLTRIKKSQYTGATTKLAEKDLKNQPFGSFDQILQGRVPGVTALSSSGAPGTSSSVIIRGQGSIEGGSTPLYIVDGIPVEEGAFQALNPNDFASIDILRDAASAASYGSRGSAGVIVVTTKRGGPGRIKFGYSGQFGVKSKPDFAFNPMNTQELLKAQHDYGKVVGGAANTNTNIPGWYYSADNPLYAGLSPAEQALNDHLLDSISKINTNWQDEIFRNGNFSNHQITLSGGTGKTRFYNSLEFYNEEGTTLRTDMNRIAFRTNIDFADDKFSYSLSTNIGYVKRNFQQSTTSNSLGNPFLTSAVSAPYALVKNADGTFATGTGNSFAAVNQLELTELDKNYNNQVKGTIALTTGYRITNEFTANLTGGIDFRETQNSNYGDKRAYVRMSSSSITGKAGFQTEGLTRYFIGNVRPSVNYKKLLKEKHDIDVTLMGEYVTQLSKSFTATGYGTNPKIPNTIEAIPTGNTANQLFHLVGGGKSKNSLFSGLLMARYTYNGKYTFTGSYRQDGSSKLPEDTRWQDFFSVGGVWEASKEDFMKNVQQINTLRLKLSYGSSGNSNNFPFGTDYPYQESYGVGTYGAGTTIVPTYPGNSQLRWETTYVTNFGIDFEMFNRRLYGDINLYSKITKDLFVQKKLIAETGFGGDPFALNAGKLSNKGIEVSINYEIIRKKDLIWTVFGNFAYNKNNVEDLGGVPSYEVGTEFVTVGMPLGSHYEVKWAGVDAATGQPLYYTKDGLITNVRDDNDRVQTFGTWEAPWKGGFGTGVKYKGFDLNVLFSWQSGSKKVDNMEYFTENPVGFLSGGYNQSTDLHFWQQPGDQVSTPSPLYATDFSSKIIHDASFLRLRDVTLAYTIPAASLAKVKYVSGIRIYVQGSNLALWTKWRGRDPEAGATNINLSEYPNPRTITGGLEINF